MTDDSLLKLMDFSNLRARVKLHNAGAEDRGSRVDNDYERGAGVDVWLDDFVTMSVTAIEEGLHREFEVRPSLRWYIVIFHYMNGTRLEGLTLVVQRGEQPELGFTLGGGIPWDADAARRIVTEAFIPVGASVQYVTHLPADEENDEDQWCVGLIANDGSATFDAIRAAVKTVRSALCTFRGELGTDRRTVARRSLLEGRFGDLYGEVESQWLECKAELAIGSREGNHELVKSVSGIANAHQSGLLVIGMRTAPVAGRDEIVEVSPVPARAHVSDRYRKIIDSHVHPTIVGLEVDLIEADGRVVVVVSVPAQREQDKPFVTTFSVRNGPSAEPMHAVYQRRGDRTVQLSIADVHAFLTAGYQGLRDPKTSLTELDSVRGFDKPAAQ